MTTSRIRLTLTTILIVLAAVGVAPATGQAAQATPPGDAAATTTYDLPGERVFPEGIAYDPAANAFFVGSTDDGTIFRGDLATGEVTVFSPGGTDGRTAVTGLKVDAEGRLYVAGRTTGTVYIYDTADGSLLARFSNEVLPSTDTLINDIAIAPDGAAYITDSFLPTLYRITPKAGADAAAAVSATGDPVGLECFIDFTGSAFTYGVGFNANGIVATQNGAYLLIVQFDTGQLFRVDIATQDVIEVDLGGATVRAGDGLALDGQTLWVVRDDPGVIVPVTMADDFASGSVGAEFADPSFDYPTTMALIGDGTALVVNSQLDMAGGDAAPTLPFTVVRVALPTVILDGGEATPAA